MSGVLRLIRGVAGSGVLTWLFSSSQRPPQAVSRGMPPVPDGGYSATAPGSAMPGAAEEAAVGPEVRVLQVILGAIGLALMGWGAWLTFDLGTDSWLFIGLWLGAGVLGHDALLAPAVVVLGVLAVRLVPRAVRAPLAVMLIVWGSMTLVAVPVLGRFGALSDNPTLLDRPYQVSWLILTGLAVAAVAVASLIRSRRADHDRYRTATRRP